MLSFLWSFASYSTTLLRAQLLLLFSVSICLLPVEYQSDKDRLSILLTDTALPLRVMTDV